MIAHRLRERDLLDVARELAAAEHTTVDEMFAHRRCSGAAALRARKAFFQRCVSLGLSQSEIGRMVGLEATTVCHALKGPRLRAVRGAA